jgi:hypothetical protein
MQLAECARFNGALVGVFSTSKTAPSVRWRTYRKQFLP